MQDPPRKKLRARTKISPLNFPELRAMPGTWALLVQAVLAKWGTIDILVNGVGGWQQLAPVTELGPSDYRDSMFHLPLNLPNRHVRTRTHGGVGGVEP